MGLPIVACLGCRISWLSEALVGDEFAWRLDCKLKAQSRRIPVLR